MTFSHVIQLNVEHCLIVWPTKLNHIVFAHIFNQHEEFAPGRASEQEYTLLAIVSQA